MHISWFDSMPRLAFGPFVLDSESRALLRDGEVLPMAGRTLDTLLVLVENRGRLVTKEELLSLVWPGIVVEEGNLSQSIFSIRKALGDKPKEPRYIATIAGRGYQFVAAVAEVTGGVAASVHDKRRRSGWDARWAMSGILAVLVAAAAVGAFRMTRPRTGNGPMELTERRLTYNSSAKEVGSALLSPDGAYLAYSDAGGVHIRLIATGEERLIPATVIAPAGAFFSLDAWFPKGTALLGHTRESGGHTFTWALSAMGQAATELRANAWGWDVSPDGSRIAFSPVESGKTRPEIWVMEASGSNPKKLLGLEAGEFLWSVRWSPDGERLAYLRMKPASESMETCDRNGAQRQVIGAAQGAGQWVRSLWWLPAGRIVYSRAEAADRDANLWQIGVDGRTGAASGKPRRLTRWMGSDVLGLSASADGTKMVLRKETSPSQVYVGEVTAGTKVVRAQRLTDDEAQNWATAWTVDGKAVLFASDRGGKWGIFKQGVIFEPGLREEIAQTLIAGRETVHLPRLSPDGAWVLYGEKPVEEGGASRGYRLMRLPINGGTPRVVDENAKARLQDYPCARAPARDCVLIEGSLDERGLTVTALDPLTGRGGLLRTLEKKPGEGFAWALSPDGTMLAIAKGDEPEIHVRLLALRGGADREIDVKNWPNIASMEWSPDGKGLYCGSVTAQNGTLIWVDLQSRARVVTDSREVGGGPFIAAVPSPDGRHLALTGAIHASNAWLLEGF